MGERRAFAAPKWSLPCGRMSVSNNSKDLLRRCARAALASLSCAIGLAISSGQSAEKNGQSLSPEPQFSPAGGIYTNDFKLRLSAKAAGAVIRYTLDGSEPTAASSLFSEPLPITQSTLLKARVFAPGCLPGHTVLQTYTLVDESLFKFSSNLPLIILNSFGGYVSGDGKTPISITVVNPSNGRSFLSGPTELNGRATIHIRGRSSLEYRKRSFAVHLTDDAGAPQKSSVLGMPKDSAWILYAPYPDKTLMRDVLAYELSRNMGHYAPRTRFVELFVSRSGSKVSTRSYAGVYVFEEKIKRGKNRVNIEKLGPDDTREPAISGGYLFKKDHQDKGKPGFITNHGSQFFYADPKAEEMTPAQKSWLARYLSEFERVLYSRDFKDPNRGYAAFIDVDSFIDQHWIVEMTKNVDGIRFSNYLQKDRGGKIKMEPIWDWNLSFGNANGKQGWMPENWYWPQLSNGEYLWFGRLFQDPDFEQRYIDRWGVLRTNVFDPAKVLSRVDQLAAQLNESQARNFKRWPILGRHINPNWFVGNTYQEEVAWMKQWIQKRLAWIDQQFLSSPSFTLKNRSETCGTLVLHAASGKIYYTLDGTDPRAAGGAISTSARLYESPISLNQPLHIFARSRAGNRWSYPSAWGSTHPGKK